LEAMSVQGAFIFDPEDRIYADHFPGCAVVPGTMIIHAFWEAAQAAGFSFNGCLMEKFRFKEFVKPGAYDFSLEPRAGRLYCRLYHEGRTVACGYLKNEIRINAEIQVR
jgi:3-hydroxyacyl-[acyl-carrier-protein] dehydratase